MVARADDKDKDKDKGSTAKPVPTTQVGPSDVKVINTPTVTVGNTPTVTIGNTPTVNVGNIPTVNVGSLPAVQLAGGSIQVTQSSGRPFFADGHVSVAPGGGAGFKAFTVPAGKVAVIEFVSVMGNGASPQVALGVDAGFTGSVQPNTFGFGASMLMRTYVGPETTLLCVLWAQSAADMNCVLSGRLIDAQ